MRLFAGTPIPKDIEKRIAQIQSKLKKTGADLKIVEPQRTHLTLHFLGEVKTKSQEDIKSKLKIIAETQEPFNLELKSIGAFPNKSFIKILWIGTGKGKNKMKKLMRKTQNKLKKYNKENHKPKPHLTIARVKSGKNIHKIEKIMKKQKNMKYGEVNINRFNLYQSKLTKEGPKYTKLKEFNLKN